MAVGDAHVFPGFLTPVLTQVSFQSHRLLFSHASAEMTGENTPERKFASAGDRTHNHQPGHESLRDAGRKIKGLEAECKTIIMTFSRYNVMHVNTYESCLFLPFPKQQILDSSKLKEFADNNFKFDENGRKITRRVENTVGKG